LKLKRNQVDVPVNPAGEPVSPHSRFFFILGVFIASISVLAAYSSTIAANYSGLASGAGAEATRHLVQAEDWWNDYQDHKLREKVWETEIDNLRISLASPTIADAQRANITATIVKYQSYMDTLHADNSTTDSLANLSGKAQAEQTQYLRLLDTATKDSKYSDKYGFATTMLVIGAGLGGVSNIAKKRLLGYPCFGIGSVGVVMILLITLVPSVLGL
jgi:hypothetical protein